MLSPPTEKFSPKKLASDLETEAIGSIIIDDEERDYLLLRASRLRGGARVNRVLRDTPCVGRLFSEAPYFFTTAD